MKPMMYQPVDLNYPNLKIASNHPPIYLIDDFLNYEQCQALIEYTKDHMTPAPVVGAGNGEISNVRTSSTCYLLREDVPSIINKVCQLLQNKSKYHIELPQVGRYYTSQQYQAHYDAFDLHTEDGQRFAKNGGQRVCTILIYLNTIELQHQQHRGGDGENGSGSGSSGIIDGSGSSDGSGSGQTHFPHLNLSFQPKQGSALVFFPANLQGEIEVLALHAALPPVDTKWVCQVWVRESDYDGVPTIRLQHKI